MTIASEISRSEVYVGGGGVTSFQFPFRVLDAADVAVYVDDVLQTGGYTATKAPSGDSGTVTFDTAPALGAKIVILRDAPLLQPTDIQNNTAFYSEVLEEMGDRAEMQIQQIAEKVNRAVVVPPSQENGMTTDEFKENITSALNAAVTAASGYATAAQEDSYQAFVAAENAGSARDAASGFRDQASGYRDEASGYADNAAAAASAAIAGGMQIHPLVSAGAIVGSTCTVRYENGHVYSGDYPVVSGTTTATVFNLTPANTVQGGRQCTFELHLRHGGTDKTAAFTNSMWYRDANGIYGSGDATAIAGKANTVQNLTIRTVIPNGAGAQVYLVNEATVRVKEGDEA